MNRAAEDGKLVGHEEAWREWRGAMAGVRMHHAWILAGPKGMGKGLFARAAASELVAEVGVHQPGLEQHPDILVPLHPPENKEEAKKRDDGLPFNTKRSIPIDAIRAIQQRLVTRPTLGNRRVVIIDPADDLEKGAVNALLKSLEEPPVGTYFLLITHRIGNLLPTIRSRCRILRFAPLQSDVVDDILQRSSGADTAARAAAVAVSGGSPGVALAMLDQNLGSTYSLMQQLLSHGDSDLALRATLVTEIGTRPHRDRLMTVLELARSVLAGALRLAPAAQQAKIIEAHKELVRLSREAATYNFDTALIALEIGGLLARAAMPREAV